MRRGAIAAAWLIMAVPAAAAPYEIVANQLRPEGPIGFGPGNAALTPSSTAELERIAGFIAAKPAITLIRIEGHVADGESSQAQPLSEQRATAVVRWLVAHGADCKRLLPVGFGATRPLAKDADPVNSRIEVRMAALAGHMIGGMPADGGGKVAGDACK